MEAKERSEIVDAFQRFLQTEDLFQKINVIYAGLQKILISPPQNSQEGTVADNNASRKVKNSKKTNAKNNQESS